VKRVSALLAVLVMFILASASPALASPNPSPVAPSHTATACANVIAHNPQAGPASHSAPQAQANFGAVGATFCGV
jgi:hypothetical protein